jgi:hypothetical protein
MVIDTTHLRLQPYAPEHLLALIEGEDPEDGPVWRWERTREPT